MKGEKMTIELYKNTFVTLAEAEAYFDERFDSDKWFDEDLSEKTKEQLLVTASKKISSFDFVGSALEPGQPMAFPRDYKMPQDIKDAVCEEAYSILNQESSVHKKNQEANISSISLGVGSVSYNNTTTVGEDSVLDSKTALNLVKKWVKKGFFYGNV